MQRAGKKSEVKVMNVAGFEMEENAHVCAVRKVR